MSNSLASLSAYLDSKPIKHIHKHDAHGDTLRIDFDNNESLYVWGFDRPYDLEIVLYNSRTETIVQDYRSQACKDEAEKLRIILGEKEPFFRILHTKGPSDLCGHPNSKKKNGEI
jgi:hypothetical protein